MILSDWATSPTQVLAMRSAVACAVPRVLRARPNGDWNRTRIRDPTSYKRDVSNVVADDYLPREDESEASTVPTIALPIHNIRNRPIQRVQA